MYRDTDAHHGEVGTGKDEGRDWSIWDRAEKYAGICCLTDYGHLTMRQLEQRAVARMKLEWAQTGAIRSTIYHMLRGEGSPDLPMAAFNPMEIDE